MSLDRHRADQPAEPSAEDPPSAPAHPAGPGGGSRRRPRRPRGRWLLQLLLPRAVRVSFTPDSLERLYQSYFRRQRQENLPVLAAFGALFNSFIIVMCAVVYSDEQRATVAAAAVGLAADAALCLLCWRRKLPASPVSRGAVPYLLWLMTTVHVLCYSGLNYERFPQASDSVGWQAFFSFSMFLTLPLKLVPLLLLAALSCGVHLLVLGVTVAQRLEDRLQGALLLRQVRGHVRTSWKLCVHSRNII